MMDFKCMYLCLKVRCIVSCLMSWVPNYEIHKYLEIWMILMLSLAKMEGLPMEQMEAIEAMLMEQMEQMEEIDTMETFVILLLHTWSTLKY